MLFFLLQHESFEGVSILKYQEFHFPFSHFDGGFFFPVNSLCSLRNMPGFGFLRVTSPDLHKVHSASGWMQAPAESKDVTSWSHSGPGYRGES